MKTGNFLTALIMLLSFVAISANAQNETTFGKKEDAIEKHNEYVYNHAKAMEKAIAEADQGFNPKSYMKHAREIRKHATKSKAYVNKLQKERSSVKKSETKFNKTIEHYDNILQEEFQVEKELGMPASDRHKLASHVSIILDEIEAVKKDI